MEGVQGSVEGGPPSLQEGEQLVLELVTLGEGRGGKRWCKTSLEPRPSSPRYYPPTQAFLTQILSRYPGLPHPDFILEPRPSSPRCYLATQAFLTKILSRYPGFLAQILSSNPGLPHLDVILLPRPSSPRFYHATQAFLAQILSSNPGLPRPGFIPLRDNIWARKAWVRGYIVQDCNSDVVIIVFSYSFHGLVLMNGLQELYGWLVARGTCSRVT